VEDVKEGTASVVSRLQNILFQLLASEARMKQLDIRSNMLLFARHKPLESIWKLC